MSGVVLNAASLLVAALWGAGLGGTLSARRQHQVRLLLTVLTVLTGLAIMVSVLPMRPAGAAWLLVMGIAGLGLGSLIGHLFGFQRRLSALLAWASAGRSPAGTGFPAEAVIFAVNPLGLAGSVLAGWTGDWRLLALKSLLDALAAHGMAAAGSRTVALAAIPLLALQGTLAVAATAASRRFPDPALGAALAIAAGLILLTAVPVVLGVRRVPLANYLPSLALTPLLAMIWR
ncbi:MAG: DUF554 family protein [Verrucomicrobiae bacterium]|nr:DUF554 family protein [Verrucomicrobiae bacterium]